MSKHAYRAAEFDPRVGRRDFVKAVGATSALTASGLVLGGPALGQTTPPPAVETNVGDFLKVPRTPRSLPGPFPGRVVKVTDKRSLVDDKVDAKVVEEMLEKGISTLTGKNMKESFRLLVDPNDIVGLKVNPVGPPLINTRPELVDAVIKWLVDNGIEKSSIVIWDRFDYMLTDAGYTKERFPGVAIEGMQTMDENGNKWRGPDGNHVSIDNFDKDVYYYVKGVVGKGVKGYPNDEFYLNQHVYNNEYSYFGKLVTKKLTRIINLAAYKNTGQSISMATKSLGYGALCNVGRLHAPLGLKTNTEVLAAPVLRDKLALNITDGIRGQYDGGPDKNAQFVYPNHSLYFATDAFALDTMCHHEMVAKRREMGVTVNESPKITEYLRYAEELKLGVGSMDKIQVVRV